MVLFVEIVNELELKINENGTDMTFGVDIEIILNECK